MSVTLPTVLAVGGVTLTGEYLRRDKDPKAWAPGRVAFGVVALGLFLSAVEAGSEDVARGLAILLVTTAVLINGQPLFEFLSKRSA